VRRKVLEAVGFFDEGLQGYADWELWLRICRDHKFIGIPDELVKYRIHAGGLSSNVQHMTEDRLRAIRKHFGPAEGEVETWPTNKRRAYAFAYRTAAFEYSIQNKPAEAWRYLEQAVGTWPGILARLDTFYELACGNQPRGLRGKATLLDIDHNGEELVQQLDRLFVRPRPEAAALRHVAYGNAYLALAMLSDQAGRPASGRRYLRQAVKANPRLAVSPSVVRRYVKLSLARPPKETVPQSDPGSGSPDR
jgi:tetratricopeptide (TPR) repeat protein